jgi:hypothetical protein
MENVYPQILASNMMYKLFKVRAPEYEVPDLTCSAIFNDFTEIWSARM